MCSDVNKDWTHNDQDKDKDKDQSQNQNFRQSNQIKMSIGQDQNDPRTDSESYFADRFLHTLRSS